MRGERRQQTMVLEKGFVWRTIQLEDVGCDFWQGQHRQHLRSKERNERRLPDFVAGWNHERRKARVLQCKVDGCRVDTRR